MAPANLFVAVAGATVILLALGGLMEISARAGPFEEAVLPIPASFTVRGSYVASGPQGSPGPGGVCIPDAPGGACTAARFEVDLRLTGLPLLGPNAYYVAWVTREDDASARYLGTMTRAGDSYTLRHAEQRDAREYTRILITLDWTARPAAPTSLHVWARDVDGQGRNGPSALDSSATVTLVTGEGRVRLAEIGAMAKSVVAIGEIRSIRHVDGWAYQGWFVSTGAQPRHIAVAPFEWSSSDPSRGVLDVRVENVRVEDQSRFLVTLEPTGAPVGATPGGFPVLGATLQA